VRCSRAQTPGSQAALCAGRVTSAAFQSFHSVVNPPYPGAETPAFGEDPLAISPGDCRPIAIVQTMEQFEANGGIAIDIGPLVARGPGRD